MKNNALSSIPLVLLCGGSGILIEKNKKIFRQNKGLVEISGIPLFVWNIKYYQKYGVKKIVLSTGFQHDEYLKILQKKYKTINNNTFLDTNKCKIILKKEKRNTNTAERILNAKKILGKFDNIFVHYSDTLADINIEAQYFLHSKKKYFATLVSTNLRTRIRILGLNIASTDVLGFSNDSILKNSFINGGFYILSKNFFSTKIINYSSNSFEKKPLENLLKIKKLGAFPHRGYWHHTDNEKDIKEAEKMVERIDFA